MKIRQLEFVLLQLSQQIDELVAKVKYVLQGKSPINFICPATLYNILRNVSLHIPENYEWIAGNKMENIHSYFDLAEVTAVGDIHCIKLIINIHLKTANRHFVLYKTVALPTRISENKFVKYVFDYPYFSLDKNQHEYILLTEADLLHCRDSSITICPANVYNTHVLTC